MSQRQQVAIPAANPALYAAAIEGGYKANAYLTDYHDPYGGVGGGTYKGAGEKDGHLHMGASNILDQQKSHPMHPHLALVQAMTNPSGQPFTQCGVPLGFNQGQLW